MEIGVPEDQNKPNSNEAENPVTPGNSPVNDLETVLQRQKEKNDREIQALKIAQSRVAFFGGPREREAHPRHPLFKDQNDGWTLQRIEEELKVKQDKNDELELKIAELHTLERKQNELHRKPERAGTSIASEIHQITRQVSLHDPVAEERKALLNAYKLECRENGVPVTNDNVAKAAGWKERTPVQRWQRNDPRSTLGDDKKIRDVLNRKPHFRPK